MEPMNWIDRLELFSVADTIALALFVICWIGSTILIENAPKRYPSMSQMMIKYRRLWMEQFVTRQPRIYDSQVIGNLRQGTAFFASASMIAIGGCFALLGNAERLGGVAQDLTFENEPLVFLEIKLLVIITLAANAFLKFVWSHRLFGYCSVLMSAVPNDENDPQALPMAMQAAEINITAARGYNRGLRSVYFGIASSAWLLGAGPLIVATLLALGVVLRREFASYSRHVLLHGAPVSKS